MTDEERIGRIVLVEPSMRMLEVLAWSTRLDVALVVALDMEGGRTGWHGHFRPSKLIA